MHNAATMDPRQTFLFDLNGFIVVRGALSSDEVDAMNQAIDSKLDSAALQVRDTVVLKNAPTATPGSTTSAFSAAGPRMDMGGMLAWETPLFRRLLAHPRLVPYLTALVGEGYRLDHQPMLILQNKGSEGFSLHGGPLMSSGGAEPDPGCFNPELQYRCHNGGMFNSLLAMSVCLCDTGPDDGGYVVVKGSHKLNFAVPSDFAQCGDAEGEENVYHPQTKKGDVIFFSEATVHGAIPWQSERQRRLALYRFAPANFAYGRAYLDRFAAFGEDIVNKCTPEERVVLQYPHSVRLDRDCVVGEEEGEGKKEGEGGGVVVKTYERNVLKKAHDKKIFGTEYY